MITKEEFIKYIDNIKKSLEMEDDLNEWIRKYSDGGWCIFNPLWQIIEDEIKLMTDNICGKQDYEVDDIDYFIFELEFGTKWKPGTITENGKDIDWSTSEKLYDYMVNTYGRKK